MTGEDPQWRERGYVLGRSPYSPRPIWPDASPPRRVDWYRVLALILVFVTAALTFFGLWLVLVYVLTAF